MTREEALYHLKHSFVYGEYYLVTVVREEILEALEQEPTTKNDLGVDCISRKSIKQKLQKHHDFFVNAYGGFINLPQNDKSRVDEITNCIAMVVNEPSVTPQEPKTGKWISTETKGVRYAFWCRYKCSLCGGLSDRTNFCPNCGARMVEPQESEEQTDD